MSLLGLLLFLAAVIACYAAATAAHSLEMG